MSYTRFDYSSDLNPDNFNTQLARDFSAAVQANSVGDLCRVLVNYEADFIADPGTWEMGETRLTERVASLGGNLRAGAGSCPP